MTGEPPIAAGGGLLHVRDLRVSQYWGYSKAMTREMEILLKAMKGDGVARLQMDDLHDWQIWHAEDALMRQGLIGRDDRTGDLVVR
jgi:hypothetical protein